MNARVRSITGTYNVVRFVDADKVDQIAAILGLSAEETATMKANPVIVVTDGPAKS